MGGQRNERRKWLHCFDGVTAIIFVVALSEYDQTLYEDEKEPRMAETLEVFDTICKNSIFKNKSMIIFFNKVTLFLMFPQNVAKGIVAGLTEETRLQVDLFREKVKTVPITVFFREYKGKSDSEQESRQYISDRFAWHWVEFASWMTVQKNEIGSSSSPEHMVWIVTRISCVRSTRRTFRASLLT